MPETSYIHRTKSNHDAIRSAISPKLEADTFNFLSSMGKYIKKIESITTLGTELVIAKERVLVTPDMLKEALGDNPFNELVTIAQLGREFLNEIGFQSPEVQPGFTLGGPGEVTEHVAPGHAGAATLVQPFTVTQPGQPPLQGVTLTSNSSASSDE